MIWYYSDGIRKEKVGTGGGGGGPLLDGDYGDIIVTGDGTIWTIDADTVDPTQMTDAPALSVLGNPTNAVADPAYMIAELDHQVVRRAGTTVDFGAINLASANAVTNRLPYANLTAPTAASKLLGRGDGTGDWQEITLGTNLAMSGVTLNASGGGAAPVVTLGGDLSGFATPPTTINAQIVPLAVGTPELADHAVTFVKMIAPTADSTLIGCPFGGGTGDFEQVGVGAGLGWSGTNLISTVVGVTTGVKQDINVVDPATNWQIVANAVGTPEINDKAVTFTKIQDVTGPAVVGRFSAAAGPVERLNLISPLRLVPGSPNAMSFDQTVDLDNNARVAVRANSTGVGFERRGLNFLNGTNTTVTVADVPGSEEVTVTVSSTGGGGGSVVVNLAGDLTGSAVTPDPINAQINAGAVGTPELALHSVIFDRMIQPTADSTLIGCPAGGGTGDFEQVNVGTGLGWDVSNNLICTVVGVTSGVKQDINVVDPATNWQIVGSAVGTPELAANAVTFAKMQTITTARLLGQNSGSASVPAEVTATGGVEFASAPTNSIRTSAFTGDVSKASGGTVLTIGTGAVTTTKIADSAVTFAKMQPMSTSKRLLGRGDSWTTGGTTDDVQEITLGPNLIMTGTVLDATGGGGGGITLGDKVDIYVEAPNEWQINNNVVTNSELQDMSPLTIKGNNVDAAGDPQDLSPYEVANMLPIFGHLVGELHLGVVPWSGTASADGGTTKFLRADATWQVPAGGGAAPGAPDTAVQYRINSTTFGGDADFTYTAGTNTVSAINMVATGTITAENTGLQLKGTAGSTNNLIIKPGSVITSSAKTLTLTTGNASRTIDLGSNLTIPPDPGADRLLMWDESAPAGSGPGAHVYCSLDPATMSFGVSGTVLTATGGGGGVPIVLGGDLSGSEAPPGTLTATIVNNAITGPELATDSVTTAKILDLNVTTAKIANDAVTYAKLQEASAGNVVLTRAASSAGDYGQTALATSQLLGRGSAGDIAPIVLGANLTMTGTTLAAASGGADVTLAGTPDYITISGQVITRGLIDLTTDVSGILPTANGGLGVALADPAADRLIMWDDSAGSHAYLTAGTGLTITGTTMTATGSNTFSTVAVSGQTSVVADAAADTLTLVAGTNVTITTDAATDAITINAAGGGSTTPAGTSTELQYRVPGTPATFGATSNGTGANLIGVVWNDAQTCLDLRGVDSRYLANVTTPEANPWFVIPSIHTGAGSKELRFGPGGASSTLDVGIRRHATTPARLEINGDLSCVAAAGNFRNVVLPFFPGPAEPGDVDFTSPADGMIAVSSVIESTTGLPGIYFRVDLDDPNGNWYRIDATRVANTTTTPTGATNQITFSVGNGINTIVTGQVVTTRIRLGYKCTILGWAIIADVVGSCTLDVNRLTGGTGGPLTATDLVGTGTHPTLASAIHNSGTTLTNWTVNLNQGDILALDVESVTTCKYISLTLYVRRT